jgi:hypothetical protein
MKAVLPEPVHESYLRHRRQRTTQIILPIVLAALLFVASIVLIGISAFGGAGDAGRWAAIATMWLATHVFVLEFIFLALLLGMIYLLAQLLRVAPTYTGRAQDIVHKLAIRIRRAADMTVRPIIALNSHGATIKALLGRK